MTQNLRRWLYFLVAIILVILVLVLIVHGSKSKSSTPLGGYEMGDQGLRYKPHDCIFNPQTHEVIVDSVEWVFENSYDSICIIARNGKRAYANVNTAELITPFIYSKAWIFSCDRAIALRNDSLYILRRDGTEVNEVGFKNFGEYEHTFSHDKAVMALDKNKVGLIDTSAQWVLQPIYKSVNASYYRNLYIANTDHEKIVFNDSLTPIIQGDYKNIEVDWSEGIIVTEQNGIQHLFSYEGKMLSEFIYRRIEHLCYNTGRKDKLDNDIYEETNCYVYYDYNGNCGLMTRDYRIITPPLFNSIEAQTRNVFFAKYGAYDGRFGTLIDDHGNPIH